MSSEISIRFSGEGDAVYLTKWLISPGALRWFPMFDLREVEDSVRFWMVNAKMKASLTAIIDGVPCGMALLNLQPYKKLSHQCLLSIIVDEERRNQGIGTALLKELMRVAKEDFRMEFLHLEVYEGNPAINLYHRFGFVEFGCQKHFIKDEGKYIGKIFMQREL